MDAAEIGAADLEAEIGEIPDADDVRGGGVDDSFSSSWITCAEGTEPEIGAADLWPKTGIIFTESDVLGAVAEAFPAISKT